MARPTNLQKCGADVCQTRDLVDLCAQGKGGLKAATAVNVRHILCEKHSKATEALQKIQVWVKVAVLSTFC